MKSKFFSIISLLFFIAFLSGTLLGVIVLDPTSSIESFESRILIITLVLSIFALVLYYCILSARLKDAMKELKEIQDEEEYY